MQGSENGRVVTIGLSLAVFFLQILHQICRSIEYLQEYRNVYMCVLTKFAEDLGIVNCIQNGFCRFNLKIDES